jgi:hypothetical protein
VGVSARLVDAVATDEGPLHRRPEQGVGVGREQVGVDNDEVCTQPFGQSPEAVFATAAPRCITRAVGGDLGQGQSELWQVRVETSVEG